MPRNALPKDYVLTAGTLLEDFENIGDWTLVNGSKEADTINFKTGTQSVKVTTPVASYSTVTKNISMNMLGKCETIDLDLYMYNEPSDLASITLYISSSTSFTSFFSKVITANSTRNNMKKGWNRLSVGLGEMGNTGGESWDNTMVRLRVRIENPASGSTNPAIVSLDSITYNRRSKAKCLITFDDGHDSVYTQAFPYMNSKGMRGTAYINSNTIGNVGSMTTAQCQEIYANGWALSNHTDAHVDLSSLSNDNARAAIANCTKWLLSNGMTRGAYHVAYPWGYNTDATRQIEKELGIKTGRTTLDAYVIPPFDDMYQLTVRYPLSYVSLATVKGYIDDAIRKQATVILLFHRLAASPSVDTEWAISDFQALIDYIESRKIDTVTIDEWYEGLTNPRYRSIPLSRTEV